MMAEESNIKELVRALCTEFQLDFPQPRNGQECIDLSNQLLQACMLEFANDRILKSTIGIQTEGGFGINLSFIEDVKEDENN